MTLITAQQMRTNESTTRSRPRYGHSLSYHPPYIDFALVRILLVRAWVLSHTRPVRGVGNPCDNKMATIAISPMEDMSGEGRDGDDI